MTRLSRLLEIAAFLGIVITDSLGYVPLTQTILLLPLAWVSLWPAPSFFRLAVFSYAFRCLRAARHLHGT